MEVEERLPPCQYRYSVLSYVLYYYHDEETLNSFISPSYLRYKKGPDLNQPPRWSTICNGAPEYCHVYLDKIPHILGTEKIVIRSCQPWIIPCFVCSMF